ncbi:hypothetical protein MRX96_012697 [Rhipicephalus microplus]
MNRLQLDESLSFFWGSAGVTFGEPIGKGAALLNVNTIFFGTSESSHLRELDSARLADDVVLWTIDVVIAVACFLAGSGFNASLSEK